MSGTKTIDLSIDKAVLGTLKDPHNPKITHVETLLPFSEAVKLMRGNANIRPPVEKKPFKAMMNTVEIAPKLFHVMNRGITYLCNKIEYDKNKRVLKVRIPEISEKAMRRASAPKFGIADGGHTFEVITQSVANLETLKQQADWTEPFVRIHFVAGEDEGDGQVESIVQALNFSLAVQQYTLDEYNRRFDDLKNALVNGGFDVGAVAFRENELGKDWSVVEIVQRLACFLKERWMKSPPANMYRSRGTALKLFTAEDSHEEFVKLYDVVVDIITLPEYIESRFSLGGMLTGRKLGRLKAVKTRATRTMRKGTNYLTEHKMDMAALLPMAAAFRELLVVDKEGGRYKWKHDPKKVFDACAQDLYDVLALRSARAKTATQIGFDMEYWGTCANIVMRAMDKLQGEK